MATKKTKAPAALPEREILATWEATARGITVTFHEPVTFQNGDVLRTLWTPGNKAPSYFKVSAK